MVSSRPEPEWDEYEQAIMLAAHELDRDTCPGCGDWLSQTLTDKPPLEDDPPYSHRGHKAWCRTCIAHDKASEVLHKHDEKTRGTVADEHPPARRVWFERAPLDTPSFDPESSTPDGGG